MDIALRNRRPYNETTSKTEQTFWLSRFAKEVREMQKIIESLTVLTPVKVLLSDHAALTSSNEVETSGPGKGNR